MTVYSGVNYTNTQSSPIEQLEEGQYNSPLLRTIDVFTLTADLAALDTILMCGLIPEGAVIFDARISTGVLGGSAAINFGIQAGPAALTGALTPQAADATAYFSSLVVSSATNAVAFTSAQIGDFYTQSAYTSQVQPVITCTVATSGATGKKIYAEVIYSKNGG